MSRAQENLAWSNKMNYGGLTFLPGITTAFLQVMADNDAIAPTTVIVHASDVPADFKLEENMLELMAGEMTIGDGYTILVSVEKWSTHPLNPGEFRFILGHKKGQGHLE